MRDLMTVLPELVPMVADVNPVPWARSQMAFTLGFHIILVPLGVSWAAMTLIANYRAIRHDDADALLLAQRWSRYMAVTFEGLFFFTEAVFISICIFGWRRLRPWAHFWTGVPIPVAGVFGSFSVVAANAWMNSPEGVTVDSSGRVTDVDPVGVVFNDAMPLMAAHMVVGLAGRPSAPARGPDSPEPDPRLFGTAQRLCRMC